MADTDRLEKFDMELKEFKDILIRIEKRLTGDISSSEPGLLEDVRTLKTDVKNIDKEIESLNKTLKTIENINAQEHINTLNDDVKTLKEKIDRLYKDKYIAYGVILVLLAIGEKLFSWLMGKA